MSMMIVRTNSTVGVVAVTLITIFVLPVVFNVIFDSNECAMKFSMDKNYHRTLVDAYHVSVHHSQRSIINKISPRRKTTFTDLTIWKPSSFPFRLYSSIRNNNDDDDLVRKRRQQQQINYETVLYAILLEQQKNLEASGTAAPSISQKSEPLKFIPLHFCNDGYVELPTTLVIPTVATKRTIRSDSNKQTSLRTQEQQQQPSVSMIRCLALQNLDDYDDLSGIKSNKSRPTLLIPLLENADWWLLFQQQQQQSLSTSSSSTLSSKSNYYNVMTKFDLRRQNSIIINHPSNGLYDNLPYHWYNTDSMQQSSSSSSATIGNSKSSSPSSFGGKRECYNILLGKDWYLWNTKSAPSPIDENDVATITTTTKSLQSRIEQMQQQELESQLAECDSEIAYLMQQKRQENEELTNASSSSFTNKKDLQYWQQQRDILSEVKNKLTTEQKQMEQVESSIPSPLTIMTNNIFSTIQRNFNNLMDETSKSQTTTTSSQLATAPTTNVPVHSSVPYQNTYDMIRRRIIQDMLDADVIGVLLENTSLLDIGSGMTMGGLIILQRKAKTVQLLGETISLPSSFDGDDIYFVECHVDEAIGMSLACKLPLWIAEESWKRGSIMCSCNPYQRQSDAQDTSIWYTDDSELMVLVEGQSLNVSRTERVLPIRIPRITNLYDTVMMVDQQNQQIKSSTGTSNASKDLFPTDNVIQSLQLYDEMSIDNKARTFMAMSNTQQISLPRRRLVDQNPQIIDDLLLPYIDESVRYEYNMRTAQRRGDVNAIRELEEQQSTRSKARMNRVDAENANDDTAKEYWDKEVEFYSALRADVTQDVGSYSRFLDRDEWYERDRQRMVQRMLERESKDSGAS